MPKTLDEAIDLISTGKGRSAESVSDFGDRYRSILKEMLNSDRVANMIGSLMRAAKHGRELMMLDAMFTGVVLGMEMEKPDVAALDEGGTGATGEANKKEGKR